LYLGGEGTRDPGFDKRIYQTRFTQGTIIPLLFVLTRRRHNRTEGNKFIFLDIGQDANKIAKMCKLIE
jgi:hypothetical protein